AAVQAELKLRRPPLPQRVAERAPEDFMDERLLEESHFRFGRVDVHVDAVGRDRQEEMDLRAALLDRRDAVGLDDRVGDGPVLDDAAVHEDVLRATRRALIAERGDVALDAQPARVLLDLDEAPASAEQLEEPIPQIRRARA